MDDLDASSEDVNFELKYHDSGSKVDMIGTIERKIKQFQPEIINDVWITVKRAKGAKKNYKNSNHIASCIGRNDTICSNIFSLIISN